MDARFERQLPLLGEDSVDILKSKTVAIFGLGGVGSYAAEAIARCGVGRMVIIDSDLVSESNINRQLCALTSTVGLKKAQVVADRIRDINPSAEVIPREEFFLPENSGDFDFSQFDFVVDAVDTVSAKVEIAVKCMESNVPMISCMGTGNKLSPTALRVADLSKTSGCPLARVMRRELKKRGITHIPVVYSEETPIKRGGENDGRKVPPASVSFVPSVAGLIAASETIKKLLRGE